ncbi:MAG: preprotein translocase subunit SecA [Candidatus Eiseniibacteriota bacterium]|jgi:preprotein translocase subunit SecA
MSIVERAIGKLFGGTKHERDRKRMLPIVDSINGVYEELAALSDEALRAKTDAFRQRLQDGEGIDELLPEAYAVVKDACRRHRGRTWKVCEIETGWDMVPFDVQLMGAIALHEGKIAEMATGEGKTLVAVMPLYLNALSGRGVHLVTVNDYLARRDSEWMGQILRFLGLTVGVIQHDMTPAERREAYACDVVYGTNNEFGFDYLRDNMAVRLEDRVQRGHHYVIVDEVDSVLIDEARTPLIISGPVQQSDEQYTTLKPLVERVVRSQTRQVNDIMAEVEKLRRQLEHLGDRGNGADGEGEQGGGRRGKRGERGRGRAGADPAADDAEEESLSPGDLESEIGFKLVLVQRGSPKNRRLLKLYADHPSMKKLAQRAEGEILRDKQMHEVDEQLYFIIDEKNHVTDLSEQGRELLAPQDREFFVMPDLAVDLDHIDHDESLSPEERIQKRDALYRTYAERSDRIHAVHQLLRAYALYERDDEYVVQDGKVVIVDEFTGRMMPGRRFSDGLHQALEAKESVKVGDEMQTFATITLQNYFRLYDKLAGMTGTAETEASEFFEIYGLDVVVIPTNQPVRRVDYDDVIFKTRREKYNALIEEIEALQEEGRPVLVGTVSVEVSETLARMLKRKGIKHDVLNAKNHQREAEIVSNAGQPGTVTIATNMAGRGTDIKLGPGVVRGEHCVIRCDLPLEACGATESKKQCEEDMPCGLAIIGTERHESRRIDRQLRGRAGRQGDPGSSRFFLSLEDDLMRLFAPERLAGMMEKLGVQDGEVIEHPWVTKSIERAQKRVEGHNFEIRKRLLEYDNVMNQHREVIYTRRLAALQGDDLRDEILAMLEEGVEALCREHADPEMHPDAWDLAGLRQQLEMLLLAPVELPALEGRDRFEALLEAARSAAHAAYETKESQYTPDLMRQVERYILLRVIDEAWRDHLYEVDQLRSGIGWQSIAGKDPLIEYKKEAFRLFDELLTNIHKETVQKLFRTSLVEEPTAPGRPAPQQVAARHEAVSAFAGAGAPAGSGTSGVGGVAGASARETPALPGGSRRQPVRREGTKVGRNDPCPCGSGKKYKKCCMSRNA